MANDDLLFSSALKLRELIGTRAVSSVEVTEAALARIEATQPILNAFITIDGDGAMKAARTADDAVARGGPLGALHGVPVSVKDIVNTAGLRTTWGSRLMADNVPDADAVAVDRLRRAGAVIVGKTTTSEFAHKLLTDAPLFGTTRNPWNPALTPGGSSGGSAVAVAAGMAPLSLATDAGASTRLPAALTGILGFKPTLGVIPHNQVPDGFNNFVHLGVMARTVGDVAVMLDAMSGAHRADPYSLSRGPTNTLAALSEPADNFGGLKIAWRPFAGNTLLDPEVRRCCEEALSAFREFGCAIDQRDAPIANATLAWRVLQQSNWAARFYAQLKDVADRLDPSFVEGIRAGGGYSGQDLLQAAYNRTQHYRTVQDWFETYDFVLTPTCSRPPLAADANALDPIVINGEDAGDMRENWVPYLNLFDLTGNPAISVPCGFTSAGLPVGLQIAGRWHDEARLLRVAAAFEAARPWAQHRPPASAGA